MLENKILQYARRLNKKYEFPSYVSGANYRSVSKLGKSGGHNAADIFKPFANLIISKKFGKIGDKFQNSTVGFCAEQVAANKIIKRHPSSISKVLVGSAIRPKTLQYGKKCIICKSLF